MRALVTGSTGFIGGAICQALVKRGYTVRAFHRASSNLALIKDLPVEHAVGDLTDPDSIERAMQQVDIVFHVAAMLGASSQPGRMYTVTVQGAQAVFDAALEHGVQRLVHTSSVAALGIPAFPSGQTAPEENAWINENHTWNYRADRWPYAYSKYLAEMELQKAVASGLDAVILNPSYVIGAGDLYRKTTSPLVQIARQRIPFIPTGGLNIVHIEDVVQGHLAALELGRTGERYILGGENLTLMHFAHKVAAAAGVPPPRILIPGSNARTLAAPARWLSPLLNLPVSPEILQLAGYGFYYDIRKSQEELKLPPPRSSVSALQDSLKWFRENGALD